MKISSINISNFLAIKEARINPAAPCLLIAGANGAGKSSVAEAVRHALTGEPSRVSLKKEFPALLSDGAAAGHALIESDQGDFGILLPDGKSTGPEPHPALAYCLDPARFAALSATERRAFLFHLMGIRITGATVRAKLQERGAADANASEIIPHVANGFEAAHKEAQAKARDAKAAWRATTGETYGEKKAEGWEAAAPAVDGGALAELRAAIAEQNKAIEEASVELGSLEANARHAAHHHAQRAEIEAKMAGIKEKAGRYARIQAKLHLDEKQLAEWEEKVQEAAREADGGEPAHPLSCPHCGGMVEYGYLQEEGKPDSKEPRLWAYEPKESAPDLELAAKLPEYIHARDLMKRSVENGRRDLADADQAANLIKALEEQLAEPLPEIGEQQKAISDCRNALAAAKEGRRQSAEELRQLEEAEREAAKAQEKTEKAAAHHAEVKAWELIADALSPDGIPAEFLAEALEPFNAALGDAAYIADWPAPKIEADMQISVGGRPYALRSESEKWRADAMIAAAIAKAAGLGLILLDRFDVLDLQGRGDAIAWLDDMAAKGEISTAIILGTLKAKPGNLPESFEAIWLEAGAIINEKEEIAA